MILDQYGQPWKVAHAAEYNPRRGSQFAVRKLNLDTNNTTLFQPSLREGTPDRLLGYNFFVNTRMSNA